MKKFNLVLLLVAALAVPASAQVKRITSEQTLTVSAAAGAAKRIFTYANWSRTCEPYPAPRIEILTQPEHGQVSTRSAVSTVSVAREGAADCSGRKVPGTELDYTATAGYRGPDRFDWRVVFDSGRAQHDTAIIDVK